MKKQTVSTVPASFHDATGPIPVTLMNDMVFHSVMQRSNIALKGLICALKGLNPDTVTDVILTNPIDYSKYKDKLIILDVKVILDNSEILDIELQVYHDINWERRSLLYLCRSFDCLGAGEDYALLKPTTLVAITDKDLFSSPPEFYSHYTLLNTKNYQPYSSLLNINMLYLNHTELATDKDIKNDLVHWAKLFRATTWEEVKSIVAVNPTFEEVATSLYTSNIQDEERTIFEAHEKFLMDQKNLYSSGYSAGVKDSAEKVEAAVAEKDAAVTEKDAAVAEKDAAVAEKDAAVAEKDAAVAEKDAAVAEKDAAVAEKDAAIAEKNAAVAEKEAIIAELQQLKQRLASNNISLE